jgi:hypothetical protein
VLPTEVDQDRRGGESKMLLYAPPKWILLCCILYAEAQSKRF